MCVHSSQPLKKTGLPEQFSENSFVFKLIEECKEDDLIQKEEYYIEKFKSSDEKFGYNINIKCDRPPSWLGKKHSSETKEKLRILNTGKIQSEYAKKVASKVHKGKKISDKQKQFLIESNKGEKNPMYGRNIYDIWIEKYGKEISDEKHKKWKENIAKGNTGRITSEETKKKISKANKGRPLSEKVKEKLRNHRLGKKASEETKKLMSQKRKGENNPACKLSDLDVRNIKNSSNIGVTELARIYNVSRQTIYSVKKGKR